MSLEGALPVFEILSMPIRLAGGPGNSFIGGMLVDHSGAVPTVVGTNNVYGFLKPLQAYGGDTVTVAVMGVVYARFVAGLVNVPTGSRLTVGTNGMLQVAAAGQFVIGRLLDPIGATATVSGQGGRILITREGNA